MRNVPVWIDDTPIRKFPKRQRNISVDVLVVGAGVTGITVAYLLKKTGSTVALIERERVASIDTGHTTAHLTYVTDLKLQELVRNFGKDHAQAAWDAGAAAIDEIERIVEEEGIECEFVRVPAYLHARVGASSKKEASSLKKEADRAAKLGFDATYLDSAPYFNLPAVRFANQAKFHPRKYLRSLVAKIPGNGSHVFEKSAASEFVEESKVRKAGAWAAEKLGRARLIIAGNEPGSLGLVLTLEGLIMGITGKKLMWIALAAAKLPPLNTYNFERLQRRAEQQIERIEAERISAVCQVFAGATRSN